MALIAIASDKGAPGVTTAALALAAVWPRPVLLAECDPAGGDLVYRFPAVGGGHLDPRRGVLSLAVVARRGMQPQQVWEHVQKLPRRPRRAGRGDQRGTGSRAEPALGPDRQGACVHAAGRRDRGLRAARRRRSALRPARRGDHGGARVQGSRRRRDQAPRSRDRLRRGRAEPGQAELRGRCRNRRRPQEVPRVARRGAARARPGQRPGDRARRHRPRHQGRRPAER